MCAKFLSNRSAFLAKALGVQGGFTKPKKLEGPSQPGCGIGRCERVVRFSCKQKQ
jgi:hypothetical protein